MHNFYLKARYPWSSPWGYLSLPPALDAPGSLLGAISVFHTLSAFLPSLLAPGLWFVPWISLHSISLGYLGTSVLSVNHVSGFRWNS